VVATVTLRVAVPVPGLALGVSLRPGFASRLLTGLVGLQMVQGIHEAGVRVSLAVRGHVCDRVGQAGHRA